MRKGYSLQRLDGKVTFVEIKGYVVHNSYGLDLMVYRGEKIIGSSSLKCWYVVEQKSGVSIAEGSSRKEAEDEVFRVLRRLGEERVRYTVNEAVKKYGCSPTYKVTEVY